jgi:hypothetical protein
MRADNVRCKENIGKAGRINRDAYHNCSADKHKIYQEVPWLTELGGCHLKLAPVGIHYITNQPMWHSRCQATQCSQKYVSKMIPRLGPVIRNDVTRRHN